VGVGLQNNQSCGGFLFGVFSRGFCAWHAEVLDGSWDRYADPKISSWKKASARGITDAGLGSYWLRKSRASLGVRCAVAIHSFERELLQFYLQPSLHSLTTIATCACTKFLLADFPI